MISRAVVRFKEDDGRLVNYVTHVNHIDDFYPKFAQDFDESKTDYNVQWQGSFQGPRSRFPAQILVLGGEFTSWKVRLTSIGFVFVWLNVFCHSVCISVPFLYVIVFCLSVLQFLKKKLG